jgi:hypothetical protein
MKSPSDDLIDTLSLTRVLTRERVGVWDSAPLPGELASKDNLGA